jgi:Leucine Rich repeat
MTRNTNNRESKNPKKRERKPTDAKQDRRDRVGNRGPHHHHHHQQQSKKKEHKQTIQKKQKDNAKMEEEQRQQQRQQQQPPALIHGAVVEGIERLAEERPRHGKATTRHVLYINGNRYADSSKPSCLDRRSLQHLVDFILDNSHHHHHHHHHRAGNAAAAQDEEEEEEEEEEVIIVTELELANVRLVSDPSPDGGVNVLKDFFARASDTTVTKIKFWSCDFGSVEDTLQLLAGLHSNRTVTDLEIRFGLVHLDGIALGKALAGCLSNMAQLHRFSFHGYPIRDLEVVRAMQPGLFQNANHRTLKELNLSHCYMGDEGIHLIVDALVGNTIMDAVDLSYNAITDVGLVDITRLLESTRLKTIALWGNGEMFRSDEAVTQYFVTTLHQKKSNVEELLGLNIYDFARATFSVINASLMRNQQMNRVDLVLAPPPSLQQQQRTRMVKVSHMAIAKFAAATAIPAVDDNIIAAVSAANALFKLLQGQPALLEKRLPQRTPPTITATAAANVTTTVLQQQQEQQQQPGKSRRWL